MTGRDWKNKGGGGETYSLSVGPADEVEKAPAHSDVVEVFDFGRQAWDTGASAKATTDAQGRFSAALPAGWQQGLVLSAKSQGTGDKRSVGG